MKTRPLAIACAGAFVSAMSTSLVAVSAPVIARDLSARPADVSWVLSAYLLAVSSLLALSGKAADVLGQKRVYLTGFIFFVCGSLICAVAPDLRTLIGARVVQGIGASMLMAVGPSIVTRAVAPHQRARGLGIQLATLSIGLTLGPSIGGLLSAHVGWHAVFIVTAALGATAFAAAVFLLPADSARRGSEGEARSKRASLDLPGAALFAVGLSALLIALKRTQDDGWTGRPVLLLGGSGLFAFLVFARHTRASTSPLLPLALFRRPPFTFGVLGATLLYTVTFMLAYLLPFQLQRGAGLSPSQAGAFMTAQPAMMAVIAPLSGAIADRWGPRVPSVAGMLAIACGLVAVASHAIPPAAPLVASLALIGFGAGLYVAPNSALIMGAAPRENQSAAGAMAATARNLGMTLGIAIAASLEHAIGFRSAVLVAAALGAAGALLGMVRPVAVP